MLGIKGFGSSSVLQIGLSVLSEISWCLLPRKGLSWAMQIRQLYVSLQQQSGGNEHL